MKKKIASSLLVAGLALSATNPETFAADSLPSDTMPAETIDESVNVIDFESSVRVVGQTDTSISIEWDSFSKASQYSVLVNGESTITGLETTNYNIEGLESAGEYFIIVRAYDESGNLLAESDELRAHTNLTISSNYILKEDLNAANIYINSGTLDLNGHSLTVSGDVWLTNGTLNMNKGKLYVGGDLNISNTNKNGCHGYISMTNSEDYVFVNGNMYVAAYYESNYTAGTIEIKGDFTQVTTSYANNFYCSGSHKVVLSGEGLQSISFASTQSQFNTLDVRNFSEDGVVFTTAATVVELLDNGCNISFANGERSGWTLEEDETIDGDLNLSRGTLDLNGHKLTVTGNLIQSGGNVLVNGGELDVQGDYRVQALNGSNYITSPGTLTMTDDSDIVKVGGDFVMQSTKNHDGLLSAGTLEIAGDLTQLSGGAYQNFHTSGTHTVVLNGSEKQTVSIYNNSKGNSRITNLKIENTSAEGVDVVEYVYILGKLYNTDSVVTNSSNLYLTATTEFPDNRWNLDANFKEQRTIPQGLSIGGSLYANASLTLPEGLDIGKSLYANSSITLASDTNVTDDLRINNGLNLNGYTLTVSGDVWLTNGTLNMNKGKLYVGGDLNISNTISATGNASTRLSANDSSYSAVTESDARLGGAVELRYLGGEVDKVKLTYKIADEYISNSGGNSEKSLDLQGIKRYNIFRYFEEINMLLPVATEVDEESHTLSAETDELGTYCVLDMEVLMSNFGIEPEGVSTETVTQQMYSAPPAANINKSKSDKYCVTFVIDERDDSFTSEQLDYINGEILSFSQEILTYKPNTEVKTITQGASWFDSYVVTDNINEIVNSSDPNVNNFVFEIFNRKDAVFEQNIANELLNKAKNSKINISIVSPSEVSLSGFQNDLAKGTNGLVVNDLDNFNLSTIYNHVYGKPLPEQDFYAVLASGYQLVKLNGRLNAFNGIDTDGDTLSDWDEVDINHWVECGLITYDDNNEIVLPTLGKCIEFVEKPYVNEGLNRMPWYYVQQLWVKSVLPITSDPTREDSDGDGYNDEQDLAPLTPFVNPVILIHGRTSNTYGAFGLPTSVCLDDGTSYNDHFGSEQTTREDHGYFYSDIETHIINIKGINPGTLGATFAKEGYKANKNLFAFNYPNQDFAQNNAPKLAEYIKNMKDCVKGSIASPEGFLAVKSDIFATKDDLKNNHASFILIGHSNGGLVSRYYIENKGGNEDVDKLITIDTPHYGSGLGTASTALFKLGITTTPWEDAVPLDVELRFDSSLFGGEKIKNIDDSTLVKIGTFIGAFSPIAFVYRCFTQHKWNEMKGYIENNQSDKLNGSDYKGDTKYYAIGGLVSRSDDSSSDMVCSFEFNLVASSVEAFQNSVNSASVYQIEFAPLSGDNVVGIKSQFGLKTDGDDVIEFVKFEKTTIVLSFQPSKSFYIFHNDILEEKQLHKIVLKYVKD